MTKDQDRDQGGSPGTAPSGPLEPTVPDDLVAMLDLLSQTVVRALGFGVAVVNIARPDGSLEVVSVAGDEQARKMLLGTVQSAEVWDRFLAVSEPWGRLRFADHRNQDADSDLLSWVPDMVPIDAEDAWHPEDALFAPLTAADGSRLGIMSVDLPRDGRRPTPATCSALEAFALSTALAIEHATLRSRAESSERSLRELAKFDSLTGVGNRSMLFERLEHAATVRPERRSLLALAFIDLDGFKIINDSYSHDIGDLVLRRVAGRIRRVVRPHDTVVRWGGDEFIVLLDLLDDAAVAEHVAQRILAAAAEPIRDHDQQWGVTVSIGLALCSGADTLDVDELVRQADSAMYRAKRAGRNTYAVFDKVDDLP